MTNLFFYFFGIAISQVYGQNQAPVGDSDTWDFTDEWGEKGYIPVYNNERALFYWAWEAQYRLTDTSEPPLVLWLSGPDGYGVSSIRDMFFNNGPYKILEFPGPYGTDTLKMTLNPFKLNKLVNMVWVDQPAGSGYSYSNTSDPVATFEEAAEDLCEFLKKFFVRYPKFLNGDFYLAGDGDAATILLALSDQLIDSILDDTQSTCPKIKYKGMIMNGPVIDTKYHWAGLVNTAKTNGVFSPSVLSTMDDNLEKCLEWFSDCEQLSPKYGGDKSSKEWSSCMGNFVKCKSQLISPSELKATGVVFDEFNFMNSDCKLDENLYTNSKCNQDFLTGLDRWLQEDEVLTSYGIPVFTTGFDMYNTTVAHDFLASGARHDSYKHCLQTALDGGLRILIWTGEYDYYGSAIGLEMLLRDMEGYGDILEQEVETWSSSYGEEVFYQSKEELIFATVAHAGHHLSFDFPRATQGFFVEWIYGMQGMSKATSFIPNTDFAVAVDTTTLTNSSSSKNPTLMLIYGSLVGAVGAMMVCTFAWCIKSKLLDRVFNEAQHEKSYYCTTEGEADHDIERIKVNIR